MKINITSIKESNTLEDIFKIKYHNKKCGIYTKKQQLKTKYGLGTVYSHSFEGLTVIQLDVILKQNLNFSITTNTLIYSALFEGEKKVIDYAKSKEILQESTEYYISHTKFNSCNFIYSKQKKIREILIIMNPLFINKHKLNLLLPNYIKFKGDSIIDHNTHLLTNKTLDILNEIILDKRNGILKRLFLESKTLELLSSKTDLNKKEKNNSTAKKIYSVEKIISSNLNKQYTISMLSKQIFVNENTLKKEFKRLFGESIFKYSLNIRMEEAKKLLYQTNKPIYEIAELVGYKNATHFTAAFKKNQQLTPKQFRKQNLISNEIYL
ncbi:AraC family transcriptional regulator [Cellulophaga baltica]|uniref:helix-turn-helix domain-containing protein n=1 Tax=Cellulophaga TaxID=104264 RepID=UPI001C06A27B|nr:MULTISPECIES: AraC family transcriptional regulator [Cellulophaga]MBU2996787.1 AraC family transcriptional regulator [Cellulophaga baltica]MDO6768183.1 AraC family transcriptional regulator [Cellulophaga sp. 1_MG-2023]